MSCAKCGATYSGRAPSRYCSKACAKRIDIATRLWARTDRSTGCWIWTGYITDDGYGVMRHNHATKLAHRIAYELHYKRDPAGKEVCHSCDTPACINPAHLFLGDHKANMQDAARKGRIKGLRQRPTGILTDAKVAEIRALKGVMTHKHIAARYGISLAYVSLLVNGKSRN